MGSSSKKFYPMEMLKLSNVSKVYLLVSKEGMELGVLNFNSFGRIFVEHSLNEISQLRTYLDFFWKNERVFQDALFQDLRGLAWPIYHESVTIEGVLPYG